MLVIIRIYGTKLRHLTDAAESEIWERNWKIEDRRVGQCWVALPNGLKTLRWTIGSHRWFFPPTMGKPRLSITSPRSKSKSNWLPLTRLCGAKNLQPPSKEKQLPGIQGFPVVQSIAGFSSKPCLWRSMVWPGSSLQTICQCWTLGKSLARLLPNSLRGSRWQWNWSITLPRNTPLGVISQISTSRPWRPPFLSVRQEH